MVHRRVLDDSGAQQWFPDPRGTTFPRPGSGCGRDPRRLRLPAVETRRKPNAEQRRRQLCDAAIALLAEEGGRGLSHQKVDRRAQVPDGTTSFYYRTRSALLHGVADQIVRYDIEFFTGAFADETSAETMLSILAEQMMLLREEPHRSRSRARLELTMMARPDSELAAGFQNMFQSYRALAERLVIGLSSGAPAPDPELVSEQAAVLLTYLRGLEFGFANWASEPATRTHIESQLRAVITGVAVEWGNAHAPISDSTGVRAK